MRVPTPSIAAVPHPIRLAVGLLIAVLVAGYTMVPALREPLTQEDGVTEWISALLFLAGGIAGTAAIRRATAPPRGSWLLPAAGFIGFGEEIAYGARILGFPLPVIDGEPVDSVHDIFDIGERFVTGLGIKRLHLAGAIAVIAVVIVAVAARRGWLTAARRWVAQHRPVAYVGVAVVLSALAVGLDLIGSSTTTRFVEEVLEVTAAGTLLAGIPTIAATRRPLDEMITPHAEVSR